MLFALMIVSYIAITTRSEVALGALLVVVSGGVQYFLRAKLQPAGSEPGSNNPTPPIR